MKKEYKSGYVTVEVVGNKAKSDPPLTLKITAPMSDWTKLRNTLGRETSSGPSFEFFDMLDDALIAMK